MSEQLPTKQRTENWLALGALAVGLPVVCVLLFVPVR